MRAERGRMPKLTTELAPLCAHRVAAHSSAARAKNGIFSRNNPGDAFRLSGQKSNKSSTNGSVTTIGLDNSPSANKTMDAM